jgi:hypothetical protein
MQSIHYRFSYDASVLLESQTEDLEDVQVYPMIRPWPELEAYFKFREDAFNAWTEKVLELLPFGTAFDLRLLNLLYSLALTTEGAAHHILNSLKPTD